MTEPFRPLIRHIGNAVRAVIPYRIPKQRIFRCILCIIPDFSLFKKDLRSVFRVINGIGVYKGSVIFQLFKTARIMKKPGKPGQILFLFFQPQRPGYLFAQSGHPEGMLNFQTDFFFLRIIMTHVITKSCFRFPSVYIHVSFLFWLRHFSRLYQKLYAALFPWVQQHRLKGSSG